MTYTICVLPVPIYQPDYEKIRKCVKASDILFTDGKHRIAGIKIIKDVKHTAEVTYIGMRVEVPFAKQIAFENGIKVITDIDFSLKLVRDYAVGDSVFYYKEALKKTNKKMPSKARLEDNIQKCDVIITDNDYFAVGLRYDTKRMEAPIIVFLSNEVITVKEIANSCNITLNYNTSIARAIFTDHNPGEELSKLYYSCVATIYSNLWKESKKKI